MTVAEAHKNLINKEALEVIINNSNLCKWAANELKLAGYIPNQKDNPNSWMYEQVMEALAVFTSHGNSGGSAPFEINLVKRLCSFNTISPLKFTDNEWYQISEDGTCQNTRKGDVFKEPDGRIHYNGAYASRLIRRFKYFTKEWTTNERPLTWHSGLFEHENGVLTGRYFCKCCLKLDAVQNGWMPKETRYIDCVEVEITYDNWIMAVQSDDIDLISLESDYDVQWKQCLSAKGVRLEDVTVELDKKITEELKK